MYPCIALTTGNTSHTFLSRAVKTWASLEAKDLILIFVLNNYKIDIKNSFEKLILKQINMKKKNRILSSMISKLLLKSYLIERI